MTAEIDSDEKSHTIAKELQDLGLIHEVNNILIDRGLQCLSLYH